MKKIACSVIALAMASFATYTHAIDITGWREEAPASTFSNNQKVNRVLQYVWDNGMDKLDIFVYVIDNYILQNTNLSQDQANLYSQLSSELKSMEGQLQSTWESNGKRYIKFDFYSLPNTREEAKSWVSGTAKINKSTKGRIYEIDENAQFFVYKPNSNTDEGGQTLHSIGYSAWLNFGCDYNDNHSYMSNCPSGSSNNQAHGWYAISFKNMKVNTITEMYSE